MMMKTIPEIFAEDGEEVFRKLEIKMLKLFGEKKAVHIIIMALLFYR